MEYYAKQSFSLLSVSTDNVGYKLLNMYSPIN